jgi:hypothetical protein
MTEGNKNAGERDTENAVPHNGGDYLWDRSGEPDAEIQKLEAALGKFSHDRPIPVFPASINPEPISSGDEPQRRLLPFGWRPLPALAFAATAAVLLISLAIFLTREKRPQMAEVGWDISGVSGTPRIAQKNISANGINRLGVGQVLETDSQSSANLQAEGVGEVEMEPDTRLRLLAMSSGQKRIALERGTIHAYIWAPPGEFVVDTPSAVTVDLGCAYTLQVDDSGAGIVRTSLGWVGFKLNGHESFIPAGAACPTRPLVGPGTPYFEDASAALRAALERFDFADKTTQERAADLATILAQARPRDALTLWHLLSRVDSDQRTHVYDHLQALAPAPPGVTREGILRLDQPMLDLWWNSLGFDDISVWRHWEHSWSAESSKEK